MTPNRPVIRTSPFSHAPCVVIAAVCALFAFGATAYGNEPMEPLYDLTQAATLEPQTYRTRSSNLSLFPVPQDNAVGTNDMGNATTLLSFHKGKLKIDDYFRNAYDRLRGGGTFLPVFSGDTLGKDYIW